MITSATIFIVAFLVYGSNGDQYLYTYDSAPNSLLVFNLVENHRLDFDAFDGGYFEQLGAGYIFARTPAGHVQSIFPVGTAIVSAPVYLTFAAIARARGETLPIATIAFERQRLHDEKTAASVMAALAAVLMFWCVLELSTVWIAAVLVAVFAFGTSMWTIGSQALWQHGPVNLLVISLTWALVRAARTRDRAQSVALALAGFAAGLLPVVRPTALLFSLAAMCWLVATRRRMSWPFALGFAAGIAPGVAWNLVNFQSLVGGYAGDAATYRFSAEALGAWLALAVSPSKGLVWYLPFVLAAPFGAIRAARSTRPGDALLAWLGGAALVLALSYGFYSQWWGGSSFGPRFLTDCDAVVVLLLVPLARALAPALRARRPPAIATAAAFGLVALYAIGVQVAGANGEAQSEWSAIPASVDTHPARIWAWSDTQIGRDARFAYRRWQPGPAAAPAYASAFAAHVDPPAATAPASPGTIVAAPGEPVDVAIPLRDTGTESLYGYTSGVWSGQARVLARINALGTPGTGATLYLDGTVAPGESGLARGVLIAPAHPGTYALAFGAYPYRLTTTPPPLTPSRYALVVR